MSETLYFCVVHSILESNFLLNGTKTKCHRICACALKKTKTYIFSAKKKCNFIFHVHIVSLFVLLIVNGVRCLSTNLGLPPGQTLININSTNSSS